MSVINEAQRLRRRRVRWRIAFPILVVVCCVFVWSNFSEIARLALTATKDLLPLATASTNKQNPAVGDQAEADDIVSALESRAGLTRRGVSREVGGRASRTAYRDVLCLARAIYHDGREYGPAARAAMAQVALNRLQTDDFGSSVCEVVYRGMGRQFGCMFREACRAVGSVPNDLDRWQQALVMAIGILKGEIDTTAVGDATHFHKKGTKPRWLRRVSAKTEVDNLVLSVEKRTTVAPTPVVAKPASGDGPASSRGRRPDTRAAQGISTDRSALGGPMPRNSSNQSRRQQSW